MSRTAPRAALIAASLSVAASLALAHGDVAPQPINTDALPDVGEAWLTENPYRGMGDDVWQTAVDIGNSGYTQNCARCHGLGAISGGLAPDLRFLEAEEYGDEWFIERFRAGYTQNGITKMPAFDGVLDQKAAWAIRTFIETRPDDVAVTERAEVLKAIRDDLAAWAAGQGTPDAEGAKAQLVALASEIETLSGAPVADSIARRAALQIDGTPQSYALAAETLTVGLSAAH